MPFAFVIVTAAVMIFFRSLPSELLGPVNALIAPTTERP